VLEAFMAEKDPRRRLKVGLFTAALLALLAFAILVIGKKQGFFVQYSEYRTKFHEVGGLVPGAPVWLSGVVVGSVADVILPADPAKPEITVVFKVQTRVSKRIRADSRVRLRTLGLLGDRYIDVTSGSESEPVLPPGSIVPSVEPTNVAEVLQRGGDVVSNVLAISASLRRILDRVDRGEGILGELTTSPESGPRVIGQLNSVLEQADAILRDVRAGRGILGHMVASRPEDEQMLANFREFVAASKQVAKGLEKDMSRDDSVVAALLRDPQERKRLDETLSRLAEASAAMAQVGEDLVKGKGTLGRLIEDQQFAGGFLDDLSALTRSLRDVAQKLDRGQGTAGKLINDPTVYEDVEHVLRGVQHSKILSWLIRNRRRAGEREAARAAGGGAQ
jgi:phospholipid/cholesterol/gamma-HCH transport system substrate-binding protein